MRTNPTFRRISGDGPGDSSPTVVKETPKKPEPRRMPADGPGDAGGSYYSDRGPGEWRRLSADGPGSSSVDYFEPAKRSKREADYSDSIRG